ncbi:MAG: ribose 5-phosphate isomerase B [Desulfobulbaceae bacterium A2]|nr:MAG: ribose 5-phosphate isomerase B [Desulfobulbaceae bacterium A2]
MRIAIASDHGGFALKQEVLALLRDLGHEVHDLGCDSSQSVDYPNFAQAVCDAVGEGKSERGILICGTGIGMSIAANRDRRIRAALCHDAFTARLSREHNDANVLCLGGRVLGSAVALDMVGIFVDTPFSGGRHQRRIDLMS